MYRMSVAHIMSPVAALSDPDVAPRSVGRASLSRLSR
jgi:hypothetical protein